MELRLHYRDREKAMAAFLLLAERAKGEGLWVEAEEPGMVVGLRNGSAIFFLLEKEAKT